VQLKSFTDTAVKALKPTTKEADYLEEGSNGFGIRVSPSGLKKFFYRYNIDSKRRFMQLGHYKQSPTDTGITLAEARRLYVIARDKVKLGIDPLTERVVAAVERKRTPFVADWVDEYLCYAKQHNRRWKDRERALKKDFVPRFGQLKITALTRRDIMAMLLDVVARGASVQANRLQSYISKVLSHAVDHGILDTNVLLHAKKVGGPETPKDRYLADNEIKTFWTGLDAVKMGWMYKSVLKLTLLTGQRPGEICQMCRDDIDGDWWIIPANASKNRNATLVYLTPTAKKLITTEDNSWARYPFFQTRDTDKDGTFKLGNKPITEDVLANRLGDVVDQLPVAKFTAHDLRRTAATGLSRLRVLPHIVERVLNHLPPKLNRTYDLHEYQDEKRDAWILWEKHILKLLGKKTKAVKVGSIPETPELDLLNTDPVES
jgi:integrase